MNKISNEQLRIMIETLKKTFPNRHKDFYKFGLSIKLLRIFIGNDWVDIVLFNKDSEGFKKYTEARTFLRSSEIGFQYQERIRRLAERIYNLQNIKNLEDVIENIKNGELVSRFAELEGATHFYRCQVPFVFVVPKGKKGEDFDIKVLTSPEINCEIKNKLENFTRNDKIINKTLKITLNKAILQVPKNEPSLFLVKIPEEWNKKLKLINNSLNEFFDESNSENVLAVILRWEERDRDNQGIFYWKFNLFKNKNFKSNKKINTLLDILVKPSYDNWVNFDNVV